MRVPVGWGFSVGAMFRVSARTYKGEMGGPVGDVRSTSLTHNALRACLTYSVPIYSLREPLSYKLPHAPWVSETNERLLKLKDTFVGTKDDAAIKHVSDQ